MQNKIGLKPKSTIELFYQYSLNGLQNPVATGDDDSFKEKMQGDMRTILRAGVSTQTTLYLLECFGSAGYALSYIRSGQDRGDFSILRAWIPTNDNYDAKKLVSFLKEALNTLDRLAFRQTAELPHSLKAYVQGWIPSGVYDKTRRLFSQIETEPRGSNAPYAWCWLKEKSIEDVIQNYIPQSNFGQYRGVFFVDTQSAPQEPSPNLALIKESDLKRVITIPTLSPELAPELGNYSIKPEDFTLSELTIDSTRINSSDQDVEKLECWAGAEVKATWLYKSKAFAPIVKRAKVQSAQDLEKLTLLQARDLKRRFRREEFRIVEDKDSNSDLTRYYEPVSRTLFSQEFSLADIKAGGLPIYFKAQSPELKPNQISFPVDSDVFLGRKKLKPKSCDGSVDRTVCMKLTVRVPRGTIEADIANQLKRQTFDIHSIKDASIYSPPADASRVAPNDYLSGGHTAKRQRQRRIVKKTLQLASYLFALLFIAGVVLVWTEVTPLQWVSKSDEAKEEQLALVDSTIKIVETLQGDLRSFTNELSRVKPLVNASSDPVQQEEWLAKIEASQAFTSRLENQLWSFNSKLRLIKDSKEKPSALQSYRDSISTYQETLRDDLSAIKSLANHRNNSQLTNLLQRIHDNLSHLKEKLEKLCGESPATPTPEQVDMELPNEETNSVDPPSSDKEEIISEPNTTTSSEAKKQTNSAARKPTSSETKKQTSSEAKKQTSPATKKQTSPATKTPTSPATKTPTGPEAKTQTAQETKDPVKCSNNASSEGNTKQVKSNPQKQPK